jgi:geranylgeranyl transferase type-2 subunit alpha
MSAQKPDWQRKAKDYSPEALAKTTELLDLNPEFYSIWNYRRFILLNGLFPTS